MKILPRTEAFVLWGQWWKEMKIEWFKIETLQDYSGEDRGASLDAWLAGDQERSIQLMHQYAKGWIEMCQKSPANKRRFHIVEKPYTPYLQWEIELYKQVNSPWAGEEVYLIPKEKVTHLDIPDGDVMIFDYTRVVGNHYTKEGLVKSMEFYEQDKKDDISSFLALRNALPQYAFPI